MTIAVRDPVSPSDNGEQLKQAMQRLAGGVVVVTAGSGAERVGLTATSAVSLSVDPPSMLVCINRTASSWPVIQRRRHFCVSILGSEHQPIAERFAGIGAVRGSARYDGAHWLEMPSGAFGLAEAQAIVDCEVDEILERHSHAILIGAVRGVLVNQRETGSLVYRRGQFRHLPA